MIYRKLDADGDYVFGQRDGDFLKNSAETVAQAIRTRLGLIAGEWFLDVTKGTPYNSRILGAHTVATYDTALQEVILGTQGVLRLTAYSSAVDPVTRAATVECTVTTIYGEVSVSQQV